MSELQIKEHGIYERRDGQIVGPLMHYAFPDRPYERWASDGLTYRDNGRWTGRSIEEHGYDLVREIVVGPGWRPWNGGKNPVPGKVCRTVLRGNNGPDPDGFVWPSEDWTWEHAGESSEIVAFFVVEATKPVMPLPATPPRYAPAFGRHPIINTLSHGRVVKASDYLERVSELLDANSRYVERYRAAETVAEQMQKLLKIEREKVAAYEARHGAEAWYGGTHLLSYAQGIAATAHMKAAKDAEAVPITSAARIKVQAEEVLRRVENLVKGGVSL